jgi:hypothetical protein
MRTDRLLAIALVIGAAAMPAAADPITDPSTVNPAEDSGFGAALFDASGLPFLLTSGPSYLQLPPHNKLRGGGSDDDEGGGPLVDAFLASFSFGSSSGSGGSSGDGGPGIASGSGEGAGLTEETLGELPGDEPGDGPGDLTFDPRDEFDDDTPRAPEPSLLLMLGTAGAYLLRRRRTAALKVTSPFQ